MTKVKSSLLWASGSEKSEKKKPGGCLGKGELQFQIDWWIKSLILVLGCWGSIEPPIYVEQRYWKNRQGLQFPLKFPPYQ